jgi:hypothetical protein
VLGVVMCSFALFIGLGWIVTKQLVDLSADLPKHKVTLIKKIDDLRPNSKGWKDFTSALSDVRAALTADRSKGEAKPPAETSDPKASHCRSKRQG